MEAYKNNETKIIENYEKTKAFLSAWFGVIITVIAIVAIFIVAAVEGTKEVRASNSVSGVLLAMWRTENNVEAGYPEEKVTIINYKNKEYYFIVESFDEEGNVLEWYWAYDAGIDYIFGDYKYYVLVGITLMFSVFVSSVNYNSTIEKVIATTKFTNSLLYYQDKKDKIRNKTQYLSKFCIYKNKQTYEEAKRSIIEKADISWEYYISKDFNFNALLRWQRKQIRKIKKIKIVRITSSDLLQEQNFSKRKIRILPEGQKEHKTKFMLSGFGSKLLTTAMSGMVAGFGIVIDNWVLGLVFGSTIIMSAIGAIVSAADYGTNTLKNRFIGKGDLLQEFDNISDLFIKENEKKLIEQPKSSKEDVIELVQEDGEIKGLKLVENIV